MGFFIGWTCSVQSEKVRISCQKGGKNRRREKPGLGSEGRRGKTTGESRVAGVDSWKSRYNKVSMEKKKRGGNSLTSQVKGDSQQDR